MKDIYDSVRNWECPKCHEKFTFSDREIKSHFERYHPSEVEN